LFNSKIPVIFDKYVEKEAAKEEFEDSAENKKTNSNKFKDFDKLKKMISDAKKIIESKEFQNYLNNLDVAHGVKTKDVSSEVLTGLKKFKMLESMIEGLKEW